MSWETSNRKERLPGNWSALRRLVLDRAGGRCEWITAWKGRHERCEAKATDVDHILAGDDHSLQNLQALCGEHHRHKSSREGFAARMARKREIRKRFRRPTERHPGALD